MSTIRTVLHAVFQRLYKNGRIRFKKNISDLENKKRTKYIEYKRMEK